MPSFILREKITSCVCFLGSGPVFLVFSGGIEVYHWEQMG